MFFWRTNRKQEIDFAADYIDKNKKRVLPAMEVKNIFLDKHAVNLRYFKKEYKEAEIYFCCLEKREPARDETIKVIYPWELARSLNLK